MFNRFRVLTLHIVVEISKKTKMANGNAPRVRFLHQKKGIEMAKMTIEQFKNSVDGLVNDFCDGISDGKEFRTGIMELLLELTEPFVAPKEVE